MEKHQTVGPTNDAEGQLRGVEVGKKIEKVKLYHPSGLQN